MIRTPVLLLALLASTALAQDHVWWEGEDATRTNFSRNTWFRPQNEGERDLLSGGAWLDQDGVREGEELFAVYEVEVAASGEYDLWTRKFWKHGPFRWRFDDGEWRECGADCALADQTDLRQHVCANWVHLGRVRLEAGKRAFEVRLLAARGEKVVACFDAFVLVRGAFQPRGKLRPGARSGRAETGWWAFEPQARPPRGCEFDLSRLNEDAAGESGFVRRKGDEFQLGNGRPVRFWGVNAGPEVVGQDAASVEALAALLASRGVNAVRIHGPVFDASASDPASVDRAYLDRLHAFVEALSREGIYSFLSFYFPLWFDVRPGHGIEGYDSIENKKPFAMLFFDPRMQAIYRSWARALLATPNPYTGRPLAKEPAVAAVELVNEDSYFFWTFTSGNVPAAPRRRLEAAYGEWLARRYRTLDAALAAWGGARQGGDRPGEGRMVLLDAWHMTREGKGEGAHLRRVQDQARFLAEHQRAFYEETIRFLQNEVGLETQVICGNWHTADPATLDSLERWTYAAGDVMDQHGYFGGRHQGPRATYQLNRGDTFLDRAGVREPGALPIQVNQVEGYPHVISEIGWTNPNRFKAEFPFLCAAYGSLQGVDGFFFFALDGAGWQAHAAKFPLGVPTILGQFPAAALLYRRGDLAEAEVAFAQALDLDSLFRLEGSAAVAVQSLDELRRAGAGDPGGPGAVDPFTFYVGRVVRSFGNGRDRRRDLSRYIDRSALRIGSLTGQLTWEYGRGVVRMDAPRVQGAAGFLRDAGRIELGDVAIESESEYASVLVVALDDEPIARSKRLLVQVATEDRPHGWRVEGDRIESLGGHPMNVRNAEITVILKGARRVARTATLDEDGVPRGEPVPLPRDRRVRLAADSMYLLATP